MSELHPDWAAQTEAVLWIGNWSSHCSHCGKNAFPHQDFHDSLVYNVVDGQWVGDLQGCGAKFIEKKHEYRLGDVE